LEESTSIGELRRIVAEVYGRPASFIDLEGAGKSITNDKYTLEKVKMFPTAIAANVYATVKDKPIVGNRNDLNPDSPGFLLASGAERVDMLLEILKMDSPFCGYAWDLLSEVPVNPTFREKIFACEAATFVEIFPPESAARCLYSLEVLLELCRGEPKESEAEKKKRVDYLTKFGKHKGFTHLQDIFSGGFDEKKHRSGAQRFFRVNSLKHIFHLMILSLDIPISDKVKVKHPIHRVVVASEVEQYSEKLQEFIVWVVNSPCNDIGLHNIDVGKEYAESISYAFDVLIQLCGTKAKPSKLIKTNLLCHMLESGLLSHPLKPIREVVGNKVEILCKETKDKGIFSIVLDLFVDLLDKISPESELAAAFFVTLQKLIDSDITFSEKVNDESDEVKASGSAEGLLSSKKVVALWKKLQDLILSHDSREARESDEDIILQGLFNLGIAIVKKYPTFCAPEQTHDNSNQSIILEILSTCLFKFPDPQSMSKKQVLSKCKAAKTRNLAFSLIESLGLHSSDYLQDVLSFVSGLHISQSIGDWNVSADDGSRKNFVGLKNQTNTCYMNSSLQQLFMVPGVAQEILRSPDEDDIPPSDSLLMQLKTVFQNLLLSEQRYFDALGFCMAFKDYEGNPIDIRLQQDVIEFINQLFDKLNDSWTKVSGDAILKNTFGGLLSYLLICEGCPHRYEREEPYIHVSLAVKDKNDIVDSLKAFIEPEMLVGDNGYKCEECNKKVDAKRISCLKTLPKTMILHLKRFDFNFETMTRQKLNNSISFPLLLDLQPYTAESVSKALDAPTQPESDSKTDLKEENQEDVVPLESGVASNALYELVGVLVHSGGAEAGHYYSFVKDRFPKSPTCNSSSFLMFS
jgi:ubiquitin C-terminal hydrolase